MNTTTMNEFKKYQDIRHIAKIIAEGLAHPDMVEKATDDLVELAAAIANQDMAGFATKSDIESLRQAIKADITVAVAEMQTTMYKAQAGSFILLVTVISKMLGQW